MDNSFICYTLLCFGQCKTFSLSFQKHMHLSLITPFPNTWVTLLKSYSSFFRIYEASLQLDLLNTNCDITEERFKALQVPVFPYYVELIYNYIVFNCLNLPLAAYIPCGLQLLHPKIISLHLVLFKYGSDMRGTLWALKAVLLSCSSVLLWNIGILFPQRSTKPNTTSLLLGVLVVCQ